MKSEIFQNENSKSIRYPCLRQRIDAEGTITVVLFINLFNGTVVYSNEDALGYIGNGWNPQEFTPFTGQVILNND
jgi:hypothetical protein